MNALIILLLLKFNIPMHFQQKTRRFFLIGIAVVFDNDLELQKQ